MPPDTLDKRGEPTEVKVKTEPTVETEPSLKEKTFAEVLASVCFWQLSCSFSCTRL